MAPANPQIRVVFPASGLELQASVLRIRMAEYTHEIAILTFPGLMSAPGTTSAPVFISWGTPTRAGVFVGYYDHVTNDATSTTVVCVGASYPLKDAAQRVWTDTTVDQVAYDIADRYQLDVDIAPHDRVFPQIVQSGESDWQLLTRLAKSVGYSCYVRQTQIRFHPRTRDFLQYQASAPIFGATDVFSFTPVNGATVPDDSGTTMTQRQLTTVDANGDIALSADLGVDPLAGSVGYSPTFTSVSQAPVDSVADALATLSADREMSRWYISAAATVRGDVALRPTAPVYLGNRTITNNGFWCVLAVEHRIAPSAQDPDQRYTAVLKLGRDSEGQSLAEPRDPMTLPASSDPLSGAAEFVSPRLLNGRWVASRSTAPMVVEEAVPDFVRDRLADRD